MLNPIYFALSIETKELQPIFRNPGRRDIARSEPSGGENQFFSQNCADFYTCLESPINPKMMTQIFLGGPPLRTQYLFS